MAESAEFVVAGGGCAAFAAAIVLAQSGADVCVVAARPTSRDMNEIPETLSGEAIHALSALGVPSTEVRRRFSPIAGRFSRWGRGPARFVPAIASPYGSAVLVGKQHLVAMLATRAITAGARVIEGTISTVSEGVNTLNVTLFNSAGRRRNVSTRFAIDATGRRSDVARSFGIRRRTFDDLVSFWMSRPGHRGDTTVALATVSDGWLFVAPHHDAVAFGFFTRGACVRGRRLSRVTLAERLSHAPELGNYAGSCAEWSSGSAPVTRSAQTTILEAAGGRRWVACGDALQTFDPLTSNGISTALAQGVEAAEVGLKHVAGQSRWAARYAAATLETFARYWRTRMEYYTGQPAEEAVS